MHTPSVAALLTVSCELGRANWTPVLRDPLGLAKCIYHSIHFNLTYGASTYVASCQDLYGHNVTWTVSKEGPSVETKRSPIPMEERKGNPWIGYLQDSVTWYGINYAGTQMTQWDFQNKGESDWTGKSSFVLEVPQLFASQYNLFCTMWPDPAKGLLATSQANELPSCKITWPAELPPNIVHNQSNNWLSKLFLLQLAARTHSSYTITCWKLSVCMWQQMFVAGVWL